MRMDDFGDTIVTDQAGFDDPDAQANHTAREGTTTYEGGGSATGSGNGAAAPTDSRSPINTIPSVMDSQPVDIAILKSYLAAHSPEFHFLFTYDSRVFIETRTGVDPRKPQVRMFGSDQSLRFVITISDQATNSQAFDVLMSNIKPIMDDWKDFFDDYLKTGAGRGNAYRNNEFVLVDDYIARRKEALQKAADELGILLSGAKMAYGFLPVGGGAIDFTEAAAKDDYLGMTLAMAPGTVVVIGKNVFRYTGSLAGQAFERITGKTAEEILSRLTSGGKLAQKGSVIHGAGNAPGIFEIGARAKSTAVVRQQLSNGRLREFVFLPDEGIFAINKHLDYRRTGPRFPGSDGSAHSTIRSTLPASSSVVGGNIRYQNGRYVTDELSGHYGRNWTDEIRAKFRKFMKEQGFEVIHDAF